MGQQGTVNIFYENNRAIVTGEDISPEIVFNCGQTFRFHQQGNAMEGVAHSRLLTAEKTQRGLELYPVSPTDFEQIWRNYFDLDVRYHDIETFLSLDPLLKQAIPWCRGLRLLNQEPFETIISFIISANNNIPRIKGIISRICMKRGEEIGDGLYAFPSPEKLAPMTASQYREHGAGYRAEYLESTCRAIAEGRFDMQSPYSLDYPEAKKRLMSLKGVGPKVADCILLFSYGKKDAFPRDVWIKRVLQELYGFVPKSDEDLLRFSQERFGRFGGVAQQYLFHYARQSKLENLSKIL